MDFWRYHINGIFAIIKYLLVYKNIINYCNWSCALQPCKTNLLLVVAFSKDCFIFYTEDHSPANRFILPFQSVSFFFKKDFIHLFEWKNERERAQAVGRGWEGGRSRWVGSLLSREPDVRALSQDPGIMTWAEGRCLTHWAMQVLLHVLLRI